MSISGFIQGLDQGVRKTAAYTTGVAFGAVNGAYKLVRGTVSGAQEGAEMGAQIGSELGSIAYRAFSAFSAASFSFLALNQTAMGPQNSFAAALFVGTVNFLMIDDSLAKRTAELAGAFIGAIAIGLQKGVKEGARGVSEGFNLGCRVGEKSYEALGVIGAKMGGAIDQAIDQFKESMSRVFSGTQNASPLERETFVFESLGRLLNAGVSIYLIAPFALAMIALVNTFDPEADIL